MKKKKNKKATCLNLIYAEKTSNNYFLNFVFITSCNTFFVP